MDRQQVGIILDGLISGNAETTEFMINKYFTEDTVFEHPFYIMRGKENVYSVWRSTFALLLVKPYIKDFWVEEGKVLIRLEMHYKGPRILPIFNIIIPLVTTLHLQKSSNGNSLISVQNDHVTTEILDRNLGWPYAVLMNYFVRPCFNTAFWAASHLLDRMEGKKIEFGTRTVPHHLAYKNEEELIPSGDGYISHSVM